MRKIYISGQITGLIVDQFTKNFSDSINHLVWTTSICRNECLNPLDLKPFLGVKCWLCYMITDVYYLRKCTHIAMQKNWIRSKGAVIEYFIAKFILKLEIIWL